MWAPHLNAWRITLTPPALLDARANRDAGVRRDRRPTAVHAALELPTDVRRWPAHLLREAGDRVEWFIDRAAARRALRSVSAVAPSHELRPNLT